MALLVSHTFLSSRSSPFEERIGSMIGKIFVLALIAFFVWGHCRQSNIRRTVGVDSLYTNQKLERTASIRADA